MQQICHLRFWSQKIEIIPAQSYAVFLKKKRSAPEFQKMWANYEILGREAPKFLEFENLLLLEVDISRFFLWEVDFLHSRCKLENLLLLEVDFFCEK